MSTPNPTISRSPGEAGKVSATPPTLHVFVFKEGMLARLGHDLRLSTERIQISLVQGKLTAQVDLGSLTVDGAMREGVLVPSALDEHERERILAHVREDVLEVSRHPTVSYEAQARADGPGRLLLTGELTLHGVKHALEAHALLEGNHVLASLELTPSHWGIKPFRALGGTLRVQDRVRIELSVALNEGVDPSDLSVLTFFTSHT